MEIRAATSEDWDAIWPFWREVVEAGETYAYPLGLSSSDARALWFSPPSVVVAVDDGRVVGTAHFGPNRPGRGSHVGTASFMVDASARARGVGRALGTHVLESLAAQGFSACQFNAVVETNAPAVHLWQALGFAIVGTVPAAFDSRAHGRVGLHVMHRFL